MYAVIQTGGKQYRVEPGQTVVVEKLPGESGEKIQFDEVLLISSGDGGPVTIGKPVISGATVSAEIVDQVLGEKHRLQVPPPQELRAPDRSSPGIHRGEDRGDQRLIRLRTQGQ